MTGAARASIPSKPRLGIMKFASCDGCQLTILDLEDHLLDLLERFDLVEFAEASSYRSSGPFDVVLVEGSVSTPEQAEEILRIRRETPLLVTIGACASAGGIQALRNWADHDAYRAAVYAHPEYVESLADVDAHLRSRRGGRGASRLPDRSAPAPRAPDGTGRRTPAADCPTSPSASSANGAARSACSSAASARASVP